MEIQKVPLYRVVNKYYYTFSRLGYKFWITRRENGFLECFLWYNEYLCKIGKIESSEAVLILNTLKNTGDGCSENKKLPPWIYYDGSILYLNIKLDSYNARLSYGDHYIFSQNLSSLKDAEENLFETLDTYYFLNDIPRSDEI